MKKTIALLVLSALFAGCHVCDSGCEQKLKLYDSIVNSRSDSGAAHDKVGQPPTTPDSFFIPYPTANAYINNWTNFIQTHNMPSGFAFSSSFILPLSNFQNLIQGGCQYVAIYLAIDTSSSNKQADTISLVYLGGQVTADSMLQLIPVTHIQGVRQAFDFTWPCPECNVSGIPLPPINPSATPTNIVKLPKRYRFQKSK